jgi:hypothetical protein
MLAGSDHACQAAPHNPLFRRYQTELGSLLAKVTEVHQDLNKLAKVTTMLLIS